MRIILHSDLNNFYASVECLRNAELKNLPVVVGGAEEERHGVVLAKNLIAKNQGISTGMTLFQARKICPDLVVFRPNFPKYLEFSKKVKQIYKRFTDKIESFGIDECWLDITNSIQLFGSPLEIAKTIKETIKKETGLTVSIGISFNKVFAKLGSDLKKPDAISIISKDNFKNVVWSLPCNALLGVGHATAKKLELIGIKTIGDISNCNINTLTQLFGKNGALIWNYANGLDNSDVFENPKIKSIGNSMTYYKDISTICEASALLMLLCESVASRLYDEHLGYATIIHLSVTENDLFSYSRQTCINATNLANDFFINAISLLKTTHDRRKSIRALGVSISGFVKQKQNSLLDGPTNKNENIQNTVENIRKKFGRTKLQRALILTSKQLAQTNIKDLHNIDASKF